MAIGEVTSTIDARVEEGVTHNTALFHYAPSKFMKRSWVMISFAWATSMWVPTQRLDGMCWDNDWRVRSACNLHPSISQPVAHADVAAIHDYENTRAVGEQAAQNSEPIAVWALRSFVVIKAAAWSGRFTAIVGHCADDGGVRRQVPRKMLQKIIGRLHHDTVWRRGITHQRRVAAEPAVVARATVAIKE